MALVDLTTMFINVYCISRYAYLCILSETLLMTTHQLVMVTKQQLFGFYLVTFQALINDHKQGDKCILELYAEFNAPCTPDSHQGCEIIEVEQLCCCTATLKPKLWHELTNFECQVSKLKTRYSNSTRNLRPVGVLQTKNITAGLRHPRKCVSH